MYTIPKKGKYLVPVKGPSLPADIVKVFPVMENMYVLFDTDGALSLFYAANTTFVPLSFPGVGCLDLDLIAHNKLKPALLCYNINYQFTIYYIDQLIARSLSNSYENIRFKKQADNQLPLTSKSRILISEFYPAKVFMFQTDVKECLNCTNLAIYYLDMEEMPLIYFMKNVTINNDKSYKQGFTSKIQSLEFVEDRLVVHYRVNYYTNYIGVYKFTETFDPYLTKLFEVPQQYQINEGFSMSYFYKHFQSSIYANKNKPYLLLPFNFTTADNEKYYNVMLIDPFAPTLETVPTFLLPKHAGGCDSCQSILFEYYVASVDRIRYYSVGLLHYSRNPHNMFRDEHKLYYILQLVTADTPKVFFSLNRDSVVSYKNLFEDFKMNKNDSTNFYFISDLNPEVVVNSSLLISQKIVKQGPDNNVTSNRSVNISKVQLEEVKDSFTKNKNDKRVVMYYNNFTGIPSIKNTTVFDWKIDAESFFDNSVGTFQFLKPLHKIKTIPDIEVETIVNIDTFCRAYKLVKGEPVCIKRGWIFFHSEDIEVFYRENLEDIVPGESVRFPFNVNECTESVVANHTLISVCTYNNERSQILTNLIDFSQKYNAISGLNIFAKFSTPRIVKTYEKSFLQFSKTIVDERNIKGVANNYYFMYEMNMEPNVARDCISHIANNLSYIYGVDSKLTDSAIGVGRIMNYTYNDTANSNTSVKEFAAYKMSGININTGNLVYVQIFEESYHIGPIPTITRENKNVTIFNRNSTSKFKIAVLKIQASTDVRRVVLNKASIMNVVFDKFDAIVKDENDPDYYRFSLIHFPSYHSYLYRYKNNTFLNNTSFYKLENPFSEIENKHWDNKPICFKWACLVVSTFDNNQNFIKVYDMRYEDLASRNSPPNFPDIFATVTNFTKEKDPVLSSESDSLDLDLINDTYTIRPIQVLPTTNLQLIRFDEDKSDNETLRVVVFFTDNKVKFFDLNRIARLTTNNLYFMSSYVDVKVQSSYNVELVYRFDINKYFENDFYKYLVQMAIIGGFSLAMVICYYRHLKAEQDSIQKADEEEAIKELETRKNILDEVKKLVFQQDGPSNGIRKSLLQRVSKRYSKKSAIYRKSFAAELIQWQTNQEGSDDEKEKETFIKS